MSHFDTGDIFSKLVVKVTVISRNPLTEEELKGFELSKDTGDSVAQMKVLEHGQLTTKQAADELVDMGKDPAVLGIQK